MAAGFQLDFLSGRPGSKLISLASETDFSQRTQQIGLAWPSVMVKETKSNNRISGLLRNKRRGVGQGVLARRFEDIRGVL